MAEKHSNLSPSQAERFFNCPGSVQAQMKIDIIEPSNPAALEGTAIHELAAKCLKENIDPFELIGDIIEVKDNYGDVIDFTITDDFAFAVRTYRNVILNILDFHKVSLNTLQIEAKFSVPEVDKLATGTTDCSFIVGTTLYVFDLKGGRGIIVDPEENKQCMYYALRPYLDAKMFIDKIIIAIIQPRAREGEFVKFWDTTPERMEQFIVELKEAVAKTKLKNPEYSAGDWCKYCKAEGNCPVLVEKTVACIENVMPKARESFPKITALTPEQIGKALPALDVIKSIIEKLEGYALSLAMKGEEIPNYTLTRGRKNRVYKDEQAVIERFEKEHGRNLFETKLRTPAQLEKIVGKTELSDYVVTPEGDIKLVPTKEAKEYVSRKVEEVFKDLVLPELK